MNIETCVIQVIYTIPETTTALNNDFITLENIMPVCE